MKFYNLDSQFTFGKFEGKTLKEVVEEEPSYISWCLVNLDHFYIANRTSKELQTLNADFSLSEEAEKKREEKLETWNRKIEEEQNYEEYHDDYSNDYQTPEDNPYYNDALDMDQQSSEFWDNL